MWRKHHKECQTWSSCRGGKKEGASFQKKKSRSRSMTEDQNGESVCWRYDV